MARDDSAAADLQAVGFCCSNGSGVHVVVLDEAKTKRGPRGGIPRDIAGLDAPEQAKDIVQRNVVKVAVEIFEGDVSRSAVGT